MTYLQINQALITGTFPESKFFFDEPLANVTFTKTGGPADVLFFPKTKEELGQVLGFCNTNQYSWTVLGNASNLIVRDGGIRGFVLVLDEMNQVMIEGNRITAEAGAKLVDVSEDALSGELTGLEFACGIPGSIGGAIFMNAGAYEGEIAQVFESCEVLTPSGEFKTLKQAEMNFSYRHSVIQENKNIILSGTFLLQKGDLQEIQTKMTQLTELRESKQPLEYPSCGSVFKRPVGHYTGKLIQEAGLQGKQIGGAQVSKKHAGFIVNIGNATATDYLDLIHYIQKVVLEKFGVTLETEVQIIGEEA